MAFCDFRGAHVAATAGRNAILREEAAAAEDRVVSCEVEGEPQAPLADLIVASMEYPARGKSVETLPGGWSASGVEGNEKVHNTQ